MPPREAWWSVHRQNTLGPFLILPLMAHWAKVTIHRAEGSKGFTEQRVVETVTTLPKTTGHCPLLACGGEMRGVEEGEGFHTREERPGTFQEAQKGSQRKS